jgi:predicted transporter
MGNGEESRTEGPLNNIFCCHASLVIDIQFLQLNLSGKSTEQGFLYYIFLYSSIYLISELLKKLLVLVLGRPPSCDWCLFDNFCGIYYFLLIGLKIQ